MLYIQNVFCHYVKELPTLSHDKTPGSSEAGGLCSVVSNRTETPALDFARESPKATSLTKS